MLRPPPPIWTPTPHLHWCALQAQPVETGYIRKEHGGAVVPLGLHVVAMHQLIGHRLGQHGVKQPISALLLRVQGLRLRRPATKRNSGSTDGKKKTLYE